MAKASVRRASYREAIAWIAENDSLGDADAFNPAIVADLTTVVLVADVFGHTASKVGQDVVNYRDKHCRLDEI